MNFTPPGAGTSEANGHKAKSGDAGKGAEICLEVLNASDYFEVLGFPKYNSESMNIPETELRKNYLKRSMKVHPDKNKHAKSTEAFQRIALAYDTLRDPAKKQNYVYQLNRQSQYSGFPNIGRENHVEFHIDMNKINLADAFALFASMVEQTQAGTNRGPGMNLFDKAADALLFIDELTSSTSTASSGVQRAAPSRLQNWSSTLRTVGMISSAVTAFANAAKEEQEKKSRQ
mmetsp:Transcript_3048/g.4105  ORF Transcript_3048/g.4105 Transcript_3048/m.4105 type:complete len:231 (-) Transcript_3048:886-1578(-)